MGTANCRKFSVIGLFSCCACAIITQRKEQNNWLCHYATTQVLNQRGFKRHLPVYTSSTNHEAHLVLSDMDYINIETTM